MGVHKKTSNSPEWGDTGRYPLGIELSKQVFSYFYRLQPLDIMSNSDSQAHILRAKVPESSLVLRSYNCQYITIKPVNEQFSHAATIKF